MSTFAGSADNGATDMEYTPERKICAAEEHFATREEVQALANDLCADIDAITERLATADRHIDILERGQVYVENILDALEREVDRLRDRVAGLEAGGRKPERAVPDTETVATPTPDPDLTAAYMLGRMDCA